MRASNFSSLDLNRQDLNKATEYPKRIELYTKQIVARQFVHKTFGTKNKIRHFVQK